MDSVKELAKQIAGYIKGKKTRTYDTAAEVRRIVGNTAYVHIPGGVPETPVKLTIDAKVGDTVQVRVANSTAWLVGNSTAPPTDDTKAKEADMNAGKAMTKAKEAETIAEEGLKEAQSTSNYFWHVDGSGAESGAHVTEIPQAEFQANPSGGNLLMQAVGIYVRKGLQKFAQFLASGLTVYSGNGTTIAHLGYGAGKDSSGGTADAPYYTLGQRRTSAKTADGVTYQPDIGNYSTAQGVDLISSKYASVAEGEGTVAAGNYSHAEGEDSVAAASWSHAGGKSCYAYGQSSYAGGSYCKAVGNDSHAEGLQTVAGWGQQFVIGTFNKNKNGNVFEIGNGYGSGSESNAFEVGWDGSFRANTETISISSSDFTTTTGSITSVDLIRFGNVVQLTMQVTKSSATAVGTNHYEGTLNLADYRPIVATECASYSGSVCVIGVINTDGSIIARVTGTQLPADRTPRLTFTYLI